MEPLEPISGDYSGNAWQAVFVAIGMALSELDFSPPERKTSEDLLHAIGEILAGHPTAVPETTERDYEDAQSIFGMLAWQVRDHVETIRREQNQ